MMEEMLEEITGGDEFWKSSTEDTFIDAIKELQEKGVDDQTIIDVLSSVYHAVGDEYGN